jgi:Concanavalin A-like lectin/glucanases superfamily
MWLAADVDATINTGSPVNNDSVADWKDNHTSGNDTSQSNDTYKPTYHTNQVNSLPAIDFDGANDVLHGPDIEMDGNTGLVLACVFKRNDANSYVRLICKDQIGINGAFYLRFDGSGNLAMEIFMKSAGTWEKATSTKTFFDSNYHYVVTYFTLNKIVLKVDGVQEASVSFSDDSIDDLDNEVIAIGGDSDTGGTPGQCFNGHIAESLVYDDFVLADIARLETFLADKYNL